MLNILRRRTKTPPRPVALHAAYAAVVMRMVDDLPNDHSEIAMHHVLYLAQVLHYARTGRTMFDNRFLATNKGPLIPILHEMQSTRRGLEQILHPVHDEAIDQEARDTIANVTRVLKGTTDVEIAAMTMAESSAWARVVLRHRRDNDVKTIAGARGNHPVTNDDIRGEVTRRYPRSPFADAA